MLQLEDLTKFYGRRAVLEGLHLKVERAEIQVVAGLNGSGKSTLLKLVAGLQRPDRGRIFIHGDEVTRLAPEDRRIGYVPQRASLFRKQTVWQNITYCLRNGRGDKRQIEKFVRMLELENVLNQRVDTLSGGYQSRVSLARSMASQPRVMLMDEPLSDLDVAIKKELLPRFKDALRVLDIAVLYVTHDPLEASLMGTRFSFLANGKLQHAGNAEEAFGNLQARADSGSPSLRPHS